MMNFEADYGLELLGEGQQMVMTPLSERTFLTLFEAFRHCKCGWVDGPTGVGKTATVTELSKALGRPCMIFSCSGSVEIEVNTQP